MRRVFLALVLAVAIPSDVTAVLVGTGFGSAFCAKSPGERGYFFVASASLDGIGCLGAQFNKAPCTWFSDTACTRLANASQPAVPRILAVICPTSGSNTTWCSDARSVLLGDGKGAFPYPPVKTGEETMFCTPSSSDNGFFIATSTSITNNTAGTTMVGCVGGGVPSDGRCTWFTDPLCTLILSDSVPPVKGIVGNYCQTSAGWCSDAAAAIISGGGVIYRFPSATTTEYPSPTPTVSPTILFSPTADRKSALGPGDYAAIALGVIIILEILGFLVYRCYMVSRGRLTRTVASVSGLDFASDVKFGTVLPANNVEKSSAKLCEMYRNDRIAPCGEEARYAIRVGTIDVSFCGRHCHTCSMPLGSSGSPGPFCHEHWTAADEYGHQGGMTRAVLLPEG